MAIKLSDLSEEDRALILQQAKEELGDHNADETYSMQVKYLNQRISEFSQHVEGCLDSQFEKTAVSDKVRPFISYIMKMNLVRNYGFPSNCQSRAKTTEQLKDFEWITDEVFKLMYDVAKVRR